MSYALCHTPWFSKKITPIFCVIHFAPYTFWQWFFLSYFMLVLENLSKIATKLSLHYQCFSFLYQFLYEKPTGGAKQDLSCLPFCMYKNCKHIVNGRSSARCGRIFATHVYKKSFSQEKCFNLTKSFLPAGMVRWHFCYFFRLAPLRPGCPNSKLLELVLGLLLILSNTR